MKFPGLLVGCLHEVSEGSIDLWKTNWESWTVRSSVATYPDNMDDSLLFGTESPNSQEIERTLSETGK